MKITPFSARPLALAVVTALALSSPVVGKSIDKLSDSPAAASGLFTGTVLFGGASSSEAGVSSVSGLPVIRPADAENLAPGAVRHVLVVVRASSLPLGEEDAATLARLFQQGAPVLVRMDSRTPDDLARVGAQFGTAPTIGDMIVRNEHGDIGVFASASEAVADAEALLDAFAADADMPRPPHPEADPDATLPEADVPNPAVGLPGRTINFSLVDPKGEINGVTKVEIVRSRTMAADFKLLRVSSKAKIAPARAGVTRNTSPDLEVISHLPIEYNLRHDVAVSEGDLVNLDHFPVTDGATEFKQEETETSTFSIGGSLGAEVSPTGKKDPKLGAKLPFDVSFGYEHKWQSTLSNSFKDYSLQAGPELPTAVAWNAVIAPRFEHLLRMFVHPSSRFENPAKKMTPMMKVAAFDAASYWQMPGTYEGPLSVTVSVGYKLDRDYWFYKGGHRGVAPKREIDVVHNVVRNTFEIPMSDPYLTAELTVLIRSATGSGLCLRDNGGVVDLVACQPTDSSQQWGFDEASRYVNRKSKKCLTAQPAAGSVVTEACGNLTFEKQWQWRADRLHSLIDHERYRMYVAGGQVLISKKGRFPDFPANFSSPALEPWSNYPAAPRQGIDLIVGRAGTRPVPIGPEYAGLPAVTDDQRWRIEVLRQGL